MTDEVLDQLHTLHDRAQEALREGDLVYALTTAREAVRFAEKNHERLDEEALLDTDYLLIEILLAVDASREALERCKSVASRFPNDPDLPLMQGMALLQLARFEEAREAFLLCDINGPRSAEVVWHLAVVAEFLGEFAESDRLYSQAHSINPELAPLPVRMGANEVQAMLTDVIDDLPPEVAEVLANVVMEIEPLPAESLLRETEPPLSPFVLGLYLGTAWSEKSVMWSEVGVDRILVFQRNIERIAHSPEMLREQLLITLLHEIGHHLGWDEDDLTQRGLE